jgi:hypothetical protein
VRALITFDLFLVPVSAKALQDTNVEIASSPYELLMTLNADAFASVGARCRSEAISRLDSIGSKSEIASTDLHSVQASLLFLKTLLTLNVISSGARNPYYVSGADPLSGIIQSSRSNSEEFSTHKSQWISQSPPRGSFEMTAFRVLPLRAEAISRGVTISRVGF